MFLKFIFKSGINFHNKFVHYSAFFSKRTFRGKQMQIISTLNICSYFFHFLFYNSIASRDKQCNI